MQYYQLRAWDRGILGSLSLYAPMLIRNEWNPNPSPNPSLILALTLTLALTLALTLVRTLTQALTLAQTLIAVGAYF